MKALLQKELRENLGLAVLGLAIFSVLLLVSCLTYSELMSEFVSGRSSGGGGFDRFLPLGSGLFLTETGFFCALFGAVLGWVQVNNERHPDLWAFLVHRPITRTGLFLGKALAGLSLYGLAAGVPLVCYIAWTWLPGHVAAPFDPAMLQPVIALFLNGVVGYFAGMLTGLRQARWYASRALGLGTAFVVTVAILGAPAFWQALLAGLLGAAILATAVWGAFHSHGYYRNQPRLGQAALTAALAFGAVVVTFCVVAMLSNGLRHYRPPEDWASYLMAKDGTVYKANWPAKGPEQIVDLEGKPRFDPKTGQPEQFNRLVSRNVSLWVDFQGQPPRRAGYFHTALLAPFWKSTPDTLWYYWPRYGRVVGYDVRSRRLLGSLGPKGFAKDLRGGGDRASQAPGALLTTRGAVYQIDLESRTTKALFTTTNDDPIGAASEVWDDAGWQYTIVVTRRFVHLLTPDGRPVCQAPFPPSYADGSQVQVSMLEPTGRFAVWFHPPELLDLNAARKGPIHIAWMDRERGVFRTVELPNLSHWRGFALADKVMMMLVPSLLEIIVPLVTSSFLSVPVMWEFVLLNWALAAVLWVPAGLWLGRRYSFGWGAQIGWALFHLLFGLAGFLAFLSVQEWPARQPCPQCGKLRVVDRPRCEHCGAGFAPPEKTGTEIYEPLPASETTPLS
jgi:ABC-type transport system involved in multi-copper enzyme maturation permease subunit